MVQWKACNPIVGPCNFFSKHPTSKRNSFKPNTYQTNMAPSIIFFIPLRQLSFYIGFLWSNELLPQLAWILGWLDNDFLCNCVDPKLGNSLGENLEPRQFRFSFCHQRSKILGWRDRKSEGDANNFNKVVNRVWQGPIYICPIVVRHFPDDSRHAS